MPAAWGSCRSGSPLDVEADTNVRVALVPQPADYVPSPLELMPVEEPVAPERLGATLPDY